MITKKMIVGLSILVLIGIFFSGCTGDEETKKARLEVQLESTDSYLVKIQIPSEWENIEEDLVQSTATKLSTEKIEGVTYIVIEGSGTTQIEFSTDRNFDNSYPAKELNAYCEIEDDSLVKIDFMLTQSKQSGGSGPLQSSSSSAWSTRGDAFIRESGWSIIELRG